jgi:hypothetical protein
VAPYDGDTVTFGCTCTCGNCCHQGFNGVVFVTGGDVGLHPTFETKDKFYEDEDRFFAATNRVIREGRLTYPTPKFHLPSTPRWREYHTQR